MWTWEADLESLSMSLRKKLVVVPFALLLFSIGASLLIQAWTIREQGNILTRDAMRAVLVAAENVRSTMSGLRESGAFDTIRPPSGGVSYRETKLFATVPVVAAWNSLKHVARAEGYDFRIASMNPRNLENRPRPGEMEILQAFQSPAVKEYYRVDSKTGDVVYARPVRLTRDCLVCHGDPSRSASGDGKDILGFPMEGMREGQLHGAFIVETPGERLTPVVQGGVWKTVAWLVPVAALLCLILAWIVSRLSRQVDEAAEKLQMNTGQLAASAGQVASAGHLLAQSASDQALTLDRTSNTTSQLNDLSRQTTVRCDTAAGVVGEVEATIQRSEDKLKAVLLSMDDINASSVKISSIMKTIDEIAFQTNILALNAAVEAARAGEAGMGFSVVADEVRALAQRCSVASKQTADLVEDSIRNAKLGSEVSRSLSSAFQEISDKSTELKSIVSAVRTASREQAQGISQIVTSLSDIAQSTQSTAANAEEGAATGEELNNQASHLSLIAQELTTLVRGADHNRQGEKVEA